MYRKRAIYERITSLETEKTRNRRMYRIQQNSPIVNYGAPYQIHLSKKCGDEIKSFLLRVEACVWLKFEYVLEEVLGMIFDYTFQRYLQEIKFDVPKSRVLKK